MMDHIGNLQLFQKNSELLDEELLPSKLIHS